MDRGAWRAAVQGVTGPNTTEELALSLSFTMCLADTAEP